MKTLREQIQPTKDNIFLGNLHYYIKVLEKIKISAPSDIANVLRIPDDSEMLYLCRVASVKRKPVAYIESYISFKFGSLIENEDLRTNISKPIIAEMIVIHR